MIHPTDLLRTNSIIEARTFAEPVNIPYDNIDCGITKCNFLNWIVSLEKFAKLPVYVFVLSSVAFFHGVCISYFRETSEIWASNYKITQSNAEWLIYTNEFFVGLVALIVSYWGNRIHRIAWIGGLTVLHSVNCVILIIPELYRQNQKNGTLHDQEINYIAIAILITFQFFYAMTSVSFITHGITYLDDNTLSKHSPALIGTVFAAKEVGIQAGIFMSNWPIYFHNKAIFTSGIWISISIGVFVAGFLIAMFPKNLPSIMMQRMSTSILNIAIGRTVMQKNIVIEGFFQSLWRLLSNKILMVNIFYIVLIESSIINLNIFEKIFNQTKFYVSLKYDWILFPKNLLMKPIIAIFMITTGMILSKVHPKMKALMNYNIIISIVVIILFSSISFLNCEKHAIFLDKCNNNGEDCSKLDFKPICTGNMIYLSPCFANCINKTYQDSKYLSNGTYFTEGACDVTECNKLRVIYEIINIIITAFVSSLFITTLMINLRSVHKKDKSLALGVEVTLLGLIPYIPVKLFNGLFIDKFCETNSIKICRQPKSARLFLSVSTLVLMCLSAMLAIVLRFLINFNYNLEELLEEENVSIPELRPINNDQRQLQEIQENSQNSLDLDMENIGDDHDSVDSH